MPRKTVIQSLIEHTRIRPSGCIEWIGATTLNGYGQLRNKGRAILAHRAAYEHYIGPVPSGKFVCHHCDNRLCTNVLHLFVGTARENTSDMMRKGRGKALRGSDSPRAKLTDAQVVEIRRRAAAGEKVRALAREFHMNNGALSRVIRGERYKIIKVAA